MPPSPAIATALLAWYDRHHRSLPWRVSPAEQAAGVRADPYRVWLSEVMLQQTTVQAVKPYFDAFLTRWPRVEDLAAAETESVMKAWAGLGYYARARNLKKCAEVVAADHGGRFPDTVEGLKALPGIGDYTAAAIAAIAFNRQAAVLDGNVERVISRLRLIDQPLPGAKSVMRAAVAEITPADRPGDFAQAMMDLGATICTPKRPACALCPLSDACLARAGDDPERFPVKARKSAKPVRIGAAFVAVDGDGAVLLRKRPDRGLLGGMTEVPGTDWRVVESEAPDDGARDDVLVDAPFPAAPFPADWEPAGGIVHVFTHFELRLSVYRVRIDAHPAEVEGWWEPVENLSGEALPTVMKKAIAAAIPTAFPPRRGR